MMLSQVLLQSLKDGSLFFLEEQEQPLKLRQPPSCIFCPSTPKIFSRVL
uniref:Aldehyde dehydrogenase n=1 Tax=Rhizophora mucronata TaxID=61149 RepID=A0A2P2Q7B4_RHIMU